ncbi:hypothetical protein OG948_33740 [Embleya sp. NBC_00888]|uniref:hypothetical protein n=1 Tax=Embleya sp. NBC_00888 TaxID=2975960 RepID=UPI0038639BF2|nr:hypothetical protein OG948_33740 [Embleya sp. NBC_00888]
MHDAMRAAMPPVTVDDLFPGSTPLEGIAREADDPTNDGYERVRDLYRRLIDDIAVGRPYRSNPD